jgi:hypothetical protein
MPNSPLMLALALMLATPAMGQSTPTTAESGPEAAKTEAPPQLPSGSPQPAGKLPERFVPTEKISPDSVISFPSDI